MADLLGPDPGRQRQAKTVTPAATQAVAAPARSVDDFDFDEEAFLAALRLGDD